MIVSGSGETVEIAVREGHAARRLAVRTGATVTIRER
jgi:S-adenosylmethionine hydrolase